MKRYGLKLWSINENYILPARRLYEKGVYDYIELYAIPDSYDIFAAKWAELNIPYIIHGPHFMHGINFSIKEKENHNITLVNQALKYADLLKAEKVIFHPGIKGDYKETARQLKNIKDTRIIVENKPYRVAVKTKELDLNDVCVGYSYQHLHYILSESCKGFCLDIGHAICAANSMQIDYKTFLEQLITLNPYMFHISDGNISGEIDKHYNIGKGSYNFTEIFNIIPKDAVISVETEKASKDNLDDFEEDVKKLKMVG